MATPTTIVWYRRDLRTDDHGALIAAAERGRVVPVFVLDPDEGGDWPMGGATKWWLHHSLEALAKDLGKLGSGLVLRRGEPASELRAVADAVGADAVYFTESIEPGELAVDEEIEHALGKGGLETERFAPNLIWAVGSVMTKSGDPYQVFSPFWRAGLATGEPDEPVSAPKKLEGPTKPPESLDLDELGLLPEIDWAKGMRERWNPGERGAMGSLAAFIRDRIDAYHEDRDRLDIPGWSAMSPHIHFGEISVRRIWHAIAKHPNWKKHKGREHYLREVGWREFAQHLLNHFPHTPDRPLRENFKRFPWSDDDAAFNAWKRGRTGYPVVDAAMRNLWAEGWMPNRARMIVASFLCKDLLIPWQRGAQWFWDTLVDADLGSNTLGWQWTAGCGADAAPYFRIFNPISQGEKFDPKGDYVRRWVPELAGLDAHVIHKPWEATPMELAAAGVTLGETYPKRIVDHAEARDRALKAFDTIKG
ncbi:MAG: deoxyribodipyrimidine photo-lyase [Planctomycetota bacterium]|nr:MAG: deoxyribodipyrimidine photo-lyase [Planctomycetota bacterium]